MRMFEQQFPAWIWRFWLLTTFSILIQWERLQSWNYGADSLFINGIISSSHRKFQLEYSILKSELRKHNKGFPSQKKLYRKPPEVCRNKHPDTQMEQERHTTAQEQPPRHTNGIETDTQRLELYRNKHPDTHKVQEQTARHPNPTEINTQTPKSYRNKHPDTQIE